MAESTTRPYRPDDYDPLASDDPDYVLATFDSCADGALSPLVGVRRILDPDALRRCAPCRVRLTDIHLVRRRRHSPAIRAACVVPTQLRRTGPHALSTRTRPHAATRAARAPRAAPVDARAAWSSRPCWSAARGISPRSNGVRFPRLAHDRVGTFSPRRSRSPLWRRPRFVGSPLGARKIARRVNETSAAMYDIAWGLLRSRKENPLPVEDDPASSLLAERVDGQPLLDENLVGALRQCLVVGMVAPPIILGSITKHTLGRRRAADRLRAHPELMPPPWRSTCAYLILSVSRVRADGLGSHHAAG